MPAPHRRFEGHAGSVALGLAVLAGLGIFTMIWTALGTAAFPGKIRALSLEGLGTAATIGLAAGLYRRQSWAWWTAFHSCAAVSIALLAFAVAFVAELIAEGFGGHHGVVLGGQFLLCVTLAVALFIFGLPVFLLWKDRPWRKSGR